MRYLTLQMPRQRAFLGTTIRVRHCSHQQTFLTVRKVTCNDGWWRAVKLSGMYVVSVGESVIGVQAWAVVAASLSYTRS